MTRKKEVVMNLIIYALLFLLGLGIGLYVGRKSAKAGERFWMDVAIDAWKREQE